MKKIDRGGKKALELRLLAALHEGTAADVRRALAQGADPSGSMGARSASRQSRRSYPLELALWRGSVASARALLDAGADPLLHHASHAAVLALAVWARKEPMLDLALGAVAMSADRKRASQGIAEALAVAAWGGKTEAVAKLARLREPALEGAIRLLETAREVFWDSAQWRGERHDALRACARIIVESSELGGAAGLLAQRAKLGDGVAPMEDGEMFVQWVDEAISAREAVLIEAAAGRGSSRSVAGASVQRL